MAKKKMVLCTGLPEARRREIEEYCDITEAGELKHGKGNAPEEQTREECRGYEIVVLGQEPVPANHPLLSMRNVVCTPHMAGLTTDVDGWSGEMMFQEVLAYLKGEERKYIWKRI